MDRIIPILLAGGTGKRLWPLSNTRKPKQFLPLLKDQSCFQGTLQRVSNASIFTKPVVISNRNHYELVKEQAASISTEPPFIISEVITNNTAAAIATAMASIKTLYPEMTNPLLLILPCDHVIEALDIFEQNIQSAAKSIRDENIMTFGIKPHTPSTQYGYIEFDNSNKVSIFNEKPNASMAKQYSQRSNMLWNSGIFMIRRRALKNMYLDHAPDVYLKTIKTWDGHSQHDAHYIPEPLILSPYKAISFDYAILEKTKQAQVFKAEFDWQDIGSWKALAQLYRQSA